MVLGCFDTKGEDFSYLVNCIEANGSSVITINTGVMETKANFTIDIQNDAVAKAAGTTIEGIRAAEDRGKAVELMGTGAAVLLSELVSKDQVKAVIGMGGGGGTYIALAAMQVVPLGIPKLCLSTLAARDLSRQIGIKDITLMPSVVDVAGLNSISKVLIEQAAAAICGMAQHAQNSIKRSTKSIAISMFGNTTRCVDSCTELLTAKGYEVMAFHATGVGGSTMESLIREGCFDAVLDVTTTELADELCGGILSAGPDRLTAASEMGIPQLVVPGCLDMVNFAHLDTVPNNFKSRQLYSWAPDVTLMRTNKQENQTLGELLAAKLNRSDAPVKVILPKNGISQLDNVGGLFYAPDINQVLFKAIRDHLSQEIEVVEVDANINDRVFAESLVEHLMVIL